MKKLLPCLLVFNRLEELTHTWNDVHRIHIVYNEDRLCVSESTIANTQNTSDESYAKHYRDGLNQLCVVVVFIFYMPVCDLFSFSHLGSYNSIV